MMGYNSLLVRGKSWHLVFLLFFFFTAGLVRPDVVILKNGKRIDCWVEEEKEDFIRIDNGVSILKLDRSTVESIERGVCVPILGKNVSKVLKEGRDLVQKGEFGQARNLYRVELMKLESILDEYEDVPEEALELKKKLDIARRETIPPDPLNQRVEEIYQKALYALDRVLYKEALQYLNEAVSHGLPRPDIYLKLAQVAGQIERSDEAIAAYQKVLEIDAKNYFDKVTEPLAELLVKRGNQLLEERRMEEAVDCYKYYLLLRKETPDRPVDYETFTQRVDKRKGKSEEDILMEVFQYADNNDFVDLAFASITSVQKIKPGDKEVERLVTESRFLSDYLESVQKGDLKAALQLKKEMPREILKSERVARIIKRASERFAPEIRAEYLFLEAQNAFNDNEFENALHYTNQLYEEFAYEPLGERSGELRTKAEFEAPIQQGLREIDRHLEEGLVDEAEASLKKILAIKDVDKSLQWKDVRRVQTDFEKEKVAIKTWELAQKDLEKDEYQSALSRMDNVAALYPNTYAGGKAFQWLHENREEAVYRIEEKTVIERELFSPLSDPISRKNQRISRSMKADLGWKRFRDVMDYEDRLKVELRPLWLYWGVPLAAGFLFLLIMILAWARPGKGKFGRPLTVEERTRETMQIGGATLSPGGVCRFCGLRISQESGVCPHCGLSAAPTPVENIRTLSMVKRADFDPWDIRVGDDKADSFDEYYSQAEKLKDSGSTLDAIEMAEKSYQENPHSVDGLLLLAELYEKAGKADKASLCYHKVSMLDTRNLEARKKLESIKSPYSNMPFKNGPLIIVLSAAFWWMIFWVVMGIDPWAWMPRAGLCIIGFVLSIILWNHSQKRGFITVQEKAHGVIDFQYPISARQLSWRELNRQARLVAKMIYEHSGVTVPTLTTWRLVGVFLLSFTFLFSLTVLSWFHHTPAVLLGWLGCILLLVYLIEIHPRAVSAYVLLRHFFEETNSPWADPELPFKPKEIAEKLKGEFNVSSLNTLPLSWALNPYPNRRTLQGVLNSLLQTMNRHYKCHFFYDSLYVNKKFKMPMPVGFRRLTILTVMICLLTFGASLFVLSNGLTRNSRYGHQLRLGYQRLLDGHARESRSHFFRAMNIDQRGFAPNLYLGHANLQMNFLNAAENAFKAACRRGENVPLSYIDYADFLQRQKRLREAVESYQKALNLDRDNADILNNIGAIHFKLKEHEEAVKSLRRTVSLDPEHPRAYTTLGLSLEEMGREKEAEEAYRKAMEVSPDHPYTWVARNRLHKEAGAGATLPGRMMVPPEMEIPG